MFMKAKDIMTTDVLTVSLNTSVKKLAKFFIDYDISGAPVVDEHEKIIGIVTESDLIFQKKKLHLPTVLTLFEGVFFLENTKNTEKELKKIIGSTVEDIYSKDVITLEEETEVEEIATIMIEKKVHVLPVLKGEELVGIVGKADIVKGLARGL